MGSVSASFVCGRGCVRAGDRHGGTRFAVPGQRRLCANYFACGADVSQSGVRVIMKRHSHPGGFEQGTNDSSSSPPGRSRGEFPTPRAKLQILSRLSSIPLPLFPQRACSRTSSRTENSTGLCSVRIYQRRRVSDAEVELVNTSVDVTSAGKGKRRYSVRSRRSSVRQGTAQSQAHGQSRSQSLAQVVEGEAGPLSMSLSLSITEGEREEGREGEE